MSDAKAVLAAKRILVINQELLKLAGKRIVAYDEHKLKVAAMEHDARQKSIEFDRRQAELLDEQQQLAWAHWGDLKEAFHEIEEPSSVG